MLLSGLGALLAAFSSWHFYAVRGGTAQFQSFCHFGQTLNCDQVAASRFAELFWGLPLSSLGLGGFLGLAFAFFWQKKPDWHKPAARWILLLTLAFSGISLLYLVLMLTQIKTLCLMCLLIDLINLTLLGVAWQLNRRQQASQPSFAFKPWGAMATTTFAWIALSLFGLHALLAAPEDTTAIQRLVKEILATPRWPVSLPEAVLERQPTAPIQVVEFSDFQCPYCSVGALTLNAVLNHYPHKIQVFFRNYPLDQSCNPKIPTTLHPAACEAAKVVLCAQKLGKFADVYPSLFEQQASFVPGFPTQLAARLLPQADWQACLQSPQTAELLALDLQAAESLQVKSTPTFFINGYRMEGAYPVAAWIALIDQLLQEADHH